MLLTLGGRLVKKGTVPTSEKPTIVVHVEGYLRAFRASAQLTSGLSMESMWKVYRPTPIPTLSQLDAVVLLEHLADRFDGLLWQLKAPMDELFTIQQSIARAICIVRRGDAVVDNLIKVCLCR